MKPIPFIYVTDMTRSLAWYQMLIPTATVRSTSQWWSELDIDGSTLALHAAAEVGSGGGAGVAFESTEPLEEVLDRLAADGISPERGIREEPFGWSVVFSDPDGYQFQVNQHR